MYHDQKGLIHDASKSSREFPIKGGVRQGCVLSPRLFCAVLQVALANWRARVEHRGVDMNDGPPRLLDLRFADDLLLFASTSTDASYFLDEICAALRAVGLVLNVTKTKVLTSEAQAPHQLVTPQGLVVDVVSRDQAHRWLGCMLSTQQSHTRDVEFHIQAACRAFYANIRILCDKTVSLQHRLRYFDAVVSPVACYAAGHRTIFKEDLHKLDVTFRRLLRSVVGPPGSMDWSRPWHEILHVWNGRVHEQTRLCDVETWSKKCLNAHWKFASYVALLPDDRWVVRALHWVPAATSRRGGTTSFCLAFFNREFLSVAPAR